jgi:hypothetical protein
VFSAFDNQHLAKSRNKVETTDLKSRTESKALFNFPEVNKNSAPDQRRAASFEQTERR